MYVLKEDGSFKPFAIIKDGNNKESFETAIKEEHSLVEVEVSNIILPDWGDIDYFSFKGKDENGTEIKNSVAIFKLVSY